MDGSRFDDLTRFMAETPSRRTVVKAMVGAIAGGLASVGNALGAPRCKRVNQACQTTADCCPGPTANGNVYCALCRPEGAVSGQSLPTDLKFDRLGRIFRLLGLRVRRSWLAP